MTKLENLFPWKVIHTLNLALPLSIDRYPSSPSIHKSSSSLWSTPLLYTVTLHIFYLLFPLTFLIREREKEREIAWAGERSRGEEQREREKILCRLHAQCRPWCGAWSYNLGIMTWAESKSQMPNQLSHLGGPPWIFFLSSVICPVLIYWDVLVN